MGTSLMRIQGYLAHRPCRGTSLKDTISVRYFAGAGQALPLSFEKVDARLPGKGDAKSHGARPVHLILTIARRSPSPDSLIAASIHDEYDFGVS